MTIEHYPSLELCKKLTEIGFPKTEKVYSRSVGGYVTGPRAGEKFDFQIKRRVLPGEMTTCDCKEEYLCPSVMEMLDVIPTPGWDTPKIVKNYTGWYVTFEGEHHEIIFAGGNKGQCDNLPNALAEMILWLHENNYISFSN